MDREGSGERTTAEREGRGKEEEKEKGRIKVLFRQHCLWPAEGEDQGAFGGSHEARLEINSLIK